MLSGILKFYRKAIFKGETESFPNYADTDARKSLKNTETKVLIIHSKDDRVCRFENHFCELQKAVADNANVEFLALTGKGHNPNYTADAVEYLAKFSAELTQKRKKKALTTDEAKAEFVKSFDWWRMTAQDEDVWNKIFAFLDK